MEYGKPTTTKQDLANAEPQSLLDQTSDARTGIGMMVGVGAGVAGKVIEETPKMGLRHADDAAKEISTLRGIGTFKTITGALAKGMGGLAAADHFYSRSW